jgi:Tfp pilus assembly protein PilV
MFLNKRALSGVSLIEIVISLLLISLALFGFDAMQLMAIQKSRTAYNEAIANNQLHILNLQLQVAGRLSDHEKIIAIWSQENAALLPQGISYVSGDFPQYTIKICWGVDTCINNDVFVA